MAQGTNVAKYLIVFETSGVQQTQAVIKGIQTTLAPFNVKIKEVDDSMKNAGKSTKNFIQNMGELTKRAMMTIPVWLALRAAVIGFLDSVKLTIQHIIDLDKAMAKMQAVTQIVNPAQFMGQLKVNVQQLARDTGKSVTEIAEAYYRFAETGAKAEVAQAGMNTALKLSVATFSDTAEVARMLIDLYNMLGDTLPKTMSEQEKFNYMAGTFSVLWQQNAGNLNEYIDALKNFGGIARTWNLDMKQTLTLTTVLHNFMQRGGMAGTQLSRAFQELTKNRGLVTQVLESNLPTDMQGRIDWFQTLVDLMTKFNSQLKAGKDITPNMMDIFGERSQKGILNLIAGLNKFIDVWQQIKDLSPEEASKTLMNLFELQVTTIDIQTKRFKELGAQIGEAFLVGERGGDAFAQRLKEINDSMEKSIPLAEKLGDMLRKYAEISPRRAFLGADIVARTIKEMANLPELPLNPEAVGKSQKIAKGIVDWFKKIRETNSKMLAGEYITNILPPVPQKPIKTSPIGFRGVFGEGGQYKSPLITSLEQESKLQSDIADKKKEESEIDEYMLKERLKLVERLTLFGYDEITIEKVKYELMVKANQGLKDLETQRLKILDLEIKKQIEFSEGFKKSIEEGIGSLLKRESTFKDFFKRIGEYYREAVFEQAAKGMTSKLFEVTGIGAIFGNNMIAIEKMFGGMGGQIKASHLEGILAGVPYIKQAHAEGMAAGASVGGTVGAIGNTQSLLSSLFGGSERTTTGSPLDIYSSGGSVLAESLKSKKKTSTGFLGIDWKNKGAIGDFMKADTMKGRIGAGANVAMGAYELSQLYKLKGTGNALGGAMSGAMAGFMIGGPVGAIIGGVAGAMMGGKSKTTEEWNRQTFQVASRIDTTNRELSIVNRNLVALKSSIETFIMPESAYYSTKRNLEDSFSISTRRGGL